MVCTVLDNPTQDSRYAIICGVGLKQQRTNRGYTQRKLAELSGVPQPNISDIETGKRPSEQIWLGTAVRLADALACDPREFLKPDAAQPGETH